MRKRRNAAAFILAAVLFWQGVICAGAAETTPKLYALSAVLMDGESGRVLYEKDGETARANASTTKVLTCILALENAPGDDYVSVSKKAAAQPEVKLGLLEGEQYYLEDLLYSLMLKSHNDSAVAIAEHVGGSVERFADMMNEKAKELGCTDTHFVTPNGLDAKDGGGAHRTTAADLCRIMRYAIQNQTFLRITQTREYRFSDLSQKRQFSLQNTNALFDMMDGVISGKTGFTGNAGYCYVCAIKRDGKTFIIALLGSGWPNNKDYKWSDTKKLAAYGAENFFYRNIWQEPKYNRILIENGAPKDGRLGEPVYLRGECRADEELKNKKILLGKKEATEWKIQIPERINAPVRSGQKIGEAVCYLDEKILFTCPILAEKGVRQIDYSWYVDQVFHDYFH